MRMLALAEPIFTIWVRIAPGLWRGRTKSRSERKAEERARKLAERWRQHNVEAPDNADARELLSHLAEKFKSKAMRKAVRAVRPTRNW
jgi:hypothetical protein